MKINALGTMLVLTAGTVAFAQQAAAPQLEVPYQCAEITVTIHRCGKVGGQDVCMYRVDIPGSQSVEAQLKSCKLQPGGATRTPGQALNPAYLSEMPSADRVMKALKTSDPRETALRQMGAFYQLSEIIKTLSGPREIRGYMPDEQGILQEYNVALRPDGTLEGAGTVKVAGRVVTGSRGDEIVYAPRNASCAVGTLAPKGKS
jgi:hypothetical protein